MSNDSALPRRRTVLRLAVLLAASALLHLLALGWAGGFLGIPIMREEARQPVQVTLVAPPPPAPSPPPRALPAPPKPKPARRPPPPVPAALPQPEEIPSIADAEHILPLVPGPAAAADSSTQAALPAAADETEIQAAEDPPAAGNKIDLPPSARLEYDVTALRDGQNWYGSGLFRWEAAGDSYSIAGEAWVTILFKFTVLNFRSEGAITEFGIAPALYTEKPWRKNATETRFDREQGRISFSASSASYPYEGGEQDRASIAWQLAAIGRGDPARFSAGAELDILVAGARNADRWRIRILDEEDVDTPHGTFRAWHVRRDPLSSRRDQAVDIWLAPQLEWYPVKVRYTYANGDHLTMSLSELTPGTSH